MRHGWFAVKRGITEHPVFKGDMARIGYFLWMMENAAYKPVEIDIGGHPHSVPRGALCYSERFIAEKFGISQKAVRTFLRDLEVHKVIKQEVIATGNGTKSKRKQITLCNYEKYQGSEIKTKSKRNQNGSKEEQRNNIPVGGGENSPPADPKKIAFDSGIFLLGRSGISEQKARPILGKWVKDHGEGVVIEALGAAQREGAIDPVSFCEGVFRYRRKPRLVQDMTTDEYLDLVL